VEAVKKAHSKVLDNVVLASQLKDKTIEVTNIFIAMYM